MKKLTTKNKKITKEEKSYPQIDTDTTDFKESNLCSSVKSVDPSSSIRVNSRACAENLPPSPLMWNKTSLRKELVLFNYIVAPIIERTQTSSKGQVSRVFDADVQ